MVGFEVNCSIYNSTNDKDPSLSLCSYKERGGVCVHAPGDVRCDETRRAEPHTHTTVEVQLGCHLCCGKPGLLPFMSVVICLISL